MNKTKRKILEKILLSILIVGTVLTITPSTTVFANWCEEFFGNNNDLCGGPGDDDGDSSSLSFMNYQVEGELSGVKAEGYDDALTESSNLKDFIIKIVNFALSFLGLIAVVMVIYGGVMYVTAGGESEKAEKGKKNVLYATIGLIIVMGSFALVNTVISAGGGVGDGSGTSGGTVGSRNKDSFNAAAAQVNSLAKKIYDGFDFLAQVTEEIKSIQADVLKVSLNPENLPSKIEILDFLRSAKDKVEGIESRVGTFSQTEAYAKELIREIDEAIDRINSLGGDEWIKPSKAGDEHVCDYYFGGVGVEGDKGNDGKCILSDDKMGCKYSHDEQCDKWGYTQYTPGLMKAWTDMYVKFSSDDKGDCPPIGETPKVGEKSIGTSLFSLICPIRNDYYANLKDYGNQLQDIWDFISVVTAISNGDAEGYYNLMMEKYFGETSASTQAITFDEDSDFSGSNLAGNVKEWALDSSIASAGTYLLEGLKNQYKFRDEILKIEFVKAILNADVVQGNAPLTVIFDVYDSVDPAGGTFSNATTTQGIEWDLEGKYMAERLEVGSDIEGVYEDATETLELADAVVTCDDITEHVVKNAANPTGGSVAESPSGGVEGGIGTLADPNLRRTSRRCVYYYPGVYNAAVKINSRNPNLYAPGMSVVPIKVNPPKTLINLLVSSDENVPSIFPAPENVDSTDQIVMGYDASGFLTVSKRQVNFTLTDASDGITFTSKYSNPVPKKQKWYFGDGTTMEGIDTVTHQYETIGKYQVKLEVTNNSGIVDNAIFYVNVAELVANISPLKNKLFVNTPITFDGSGSKSDVGIITQYKWEITNAAGGTLAPEDYSCEGNSSGPAVKTYTCTFKKYGDYQATLTVTNSTGKPSDPTSVKFHAASQLPEAVIEYETKKTSQPSTYSLSGAKSYDPDQYDNNGDIDLAYSWEVDIDGGEAEQGEDYDWINSSGEVAEAKENVEMQVSPTLQIYKKGVYDVSLTVCDVTGQGYNYNSPDCEKSGQKYEKKTDVKKIEVEDNVDIAWGEMETPEAPDEDAEGGFQVPMTFKFKSAYVDKTDGSLTYDIDFGDGNKHSGEYGQGGEKISFLSHLFASVFLSSTDEGTDTVDMDSENNMTITHTYLSPGEYTVKLTVYDEDDNDKSITKKVYMPDGESPYAKAKVMVNDVDATAFECEENNDYFLGETKPCAIPATSKDSIIFDASESVNKDGTGKSLRYSWDFGDGVKSTEKTVTHKYSKPKGESEFKSVTLTVYDKDNPSPKSTKSIFIELGTSAPKASSVVGISDSSNSDQKAPLKFDVKAYGVNDDDGEVVQYRWFYYNEDNYHSGNTTKVAENDRYGTQLTKNPEAQLTIGSWNGKENELGEFGFGVELTDNDGKKTTVYSLDTGDPVTVKNGANKPPVAKFTTGKTKVMVGEEVQFSSFSSDSDGRIVRYNWDFGDGESVSGILAAGVTSDKNYPQVKHTYKTKNLQGYEVALSLEDDGGSPATSEPVKITVDSPTLPPTAAFTTRGAGKKVCFDYSTSKADTGVVIADVAFDFDANIDSDGDGIRDNDVDYGLKEGKGSLNGVGAFTTMSNCSEGNKQIAVEYSNIGIINAKLVVTDEEGNTDDVKNQLTLPMGNPPIAGFIYEIVGDEVQFTNTSTAVMGISAYAWDFNTAIDTSGDGVKDNDIDSSAKDPNHTYTQNGSYNVKLYVTDSNGNTDSIVNTVKYEKYVPLDAVLLLNPAAAYDGIVYLTGTLGTVSLDFSKSLGTITEYIIDKNVYYAGDAELKFTKAGAVSIAYDKSWGKTVTRLTVKDAKGNSDSTTFEVQFK